MKKNRKKLWLYGGLGLLAVALIVFAIVKGKGSSKGLAVQLDEVKIRTIHETISGSGKVYPETEVKISSDVSGEIIELYVQEGDSVRTGQILATINPDTYVSFVERAEASLNNAKAQEATMKAQIESTKAQKEQILAQIGNAKKMHERNEVLHKKGVISDAELDQSESNLKSLQANLKAAEASIRSSEQNARAAAYTVKSFEASLKESRTNLGKTTIKAPMTGIVSSLSVEAGERVVGTMQMSGTEMMRIANLQSMEVRVDISENDVLKIAVGDSTEIEVDAYLERKFTGIVTEIANSASNTRGLGATTSADQVTNFIVKVRIDPESYAELIKSGKGFPFRPGMSANVDIFTEVEHDAVSIPIQAVTTRPKDEAKDKEKLDPSDLREVVFVKQQDTVDMVDVTTGIQDDEFIHVKKGLKSGQIVVSGPYAVVSKELKQGSQIRERKNKPDQGKKEEEKD